MAKKKKAPRKKKAPKKKQAAPKKKTPAAGKPAANKKKAPRKKQSANQREPTKKGPTMNEPAPQAQGDSPAAPASAAALDGKRLYPPEGGAAVRFYRIGHGDCFLLALAGDAPDQPVYFLIDCGYKPGSPGKLKASTSAKEIWADIRAATGGHLHVALITHEHQDHVNGITESNLGDVTIGETWLAWTENPEDDVANGLRKIYHDKLRGLVAARDRLQAAGDADQVKIVDDFLEFELGGDAEKFDFAAAKLGVEDAAGPVTGNKGSMALFKQRAKDGVKFILPHEQILSVPGAKNIRVFPLGPPRKEELLEDMDPEGSEKFPDQGLAAASPGNFFGAAARASDGSPPQPLFAPRYSLDFKSAATDADYGPFFSQHYGLQPPPPEAVQTDSDCDTPDDAVWRRIDNDWLQSAEQLALAMSDYTNNTSLVLAFELGRGGKVLLFAADAQRGNWISWASKSFKDADKNGDKELTVRDLLGRVVLYKVGHHCSHNATLNGGTKDDYANIGWMAQGEYADEFTAMITAVWAWAQTQKGWYHPYPPIKEALEKKASGRVFQTDTEFEDMKMPADASESPWKRFQERASGNRLYFDYRISP